MAYEPWQPGMRITATRLRSISPTWGDWVPTWTTSTGANTPSLGNAVVSARYAQSALTVFFELVITFGMTTNFGAAPTSGDNWRFSLPVASASTPSMVGYGEISDSSAGIASRMGVRPRLTTTTVMEIEMASGRIDAGAVANVGIVDSVSPWTWASNDVLRLFGEYEAAA